MLVIKKGGAVTISSRDREIVTAVQLYADLPDSEIARKLHLREHTVRRTIAQLIERGSLRKHYLVNRLAFGMSEYGLFFREVVGQQHKQAKLIEGLRNSGRVAWMGRFIGDYTWGVGILARSPQSFMDHVEELCSKYGAVIDGKAITIKPSITLFNTPIADDTRSKKAVVEVTTSVEEAVDLEETDHAILFSLNRFPYLSVRERARQLGLAVSTLQYRLQQLRKQEVLRGAFYDFWDESLGLQVFRLLVSTQGVDRKIDRALHKYLMEIGGSFVFMPSIGAWDYEIAVAERSSAEIYGVIQTIQTRFYPHVNSVKLLVGTAGIKVSYYPFQSLLEFARA